MPAAPTGAPTTIVVRRAVVTGLACLVLFTSGAVSPEPAEGRNWSSVIAANRRSQLAYESSMRSADAQLRSLKQGIKRTKRKVKRSRRAISGVRQRRSEARQRLAATKDRLRLSRAALRASQAAETEAPAPLGEAALAAPAWPILSAATDTERLESASAGPSASLPFPFAGIPVDPPPPPPPNGDRSPVSGVVGVTPSEVRSLERTARKQGKRFRVLQRKTRRMERMKRSRIRSIRSMQRQRGAANARRAGAEAGLKGAIVSMSRLAERRAAKKTNVRPGRNTPFIWPTRGRISQGYGCTGSRFSPRRGSCAHFHDGIDIVAWSGTPIRAMGVGVVSYVGRNPWDRGKRAFMVVVAHPGGYETLYGHVLPIRQVRVGQVVRRGQVIGYMGSTGHSTGTHLHLELRRGYTTLNPLAFL